MKLCISFIYVLHCRCFMLDMVLEDNADLKEHLEQKAISKPEYSLVDTHDGASEY